MMDVNKLMFALALVLLVQCVLVRLVIIAHIVACGAVLRLLVGGNFMFLVLLMPTCGLIV